MTRTHAFTAVCGVKVVIVLAGVHVLVCVCVTTHVCKTGSQQPQLSLRGLEALIPVVSMVMDEHSSFVSLRQ